MKLKKIILLAVLIFNIGAISAYANDSILYSYEPDSFKLEIKREPDGEVNYTDRVSIAVLNANKTFETATADDYKYIEAYNQSIDDISFTYDFSGGYGVYKIRATVTHSDSSSDFVEKNFYYVSNRNINTLVTDMKGATSESINEIIKKNAVTKKFLKIDEIDEIDPLNVNLSEHTGKTYEMVRDLFVNTEGFGFENGIDVEKSLKATMFIDKLMNGTSEDFCSCFKKYVGFTMGLVDENADPTTYFDFFKSFSPTNYTDLATALRRNSLLTLINNGTSQNFIDAVTKYGDSYGVSIDETVKKGVQPGDIAVRFDKTDAKKYAVNFATVYNSTEAPLIPKNDTNNETVRPGGGSSGGSSGGGGGGGSVGSSTNYNAVENTVSEKLTDKNLPFVDVSKDMWAYDSIKMLYDSGSVSGYEDGSFKPDETVTREEFIKLIIESLKIKAEKNLDMQFLDCNGDEWYYPYVKTAYSNGIIKGKDSSVFGIGEEITREDMAVIICRAAKIMQTEAEPTFSDTDNISLYAKRAVGTINSLSVIKGYEDGSFKPHNKATRAETAVVLCRISDYLNGGTK